MLGEVVQVSGAGRAATAIPCCLDASHLVNCSLPKPKRFLFSSIIQKVAVFKEIKMGNNREV